MQNLLWLTIIAVALTVSVGAQDVYRPGSGVTLPTVN
jgi:hypothetical protein